MNAPDVVKFKIDINSQTGLGSFKSLEARPISVVDFQLYDRSDSNSFRTPSTMTPLFQSQDQLPQNNWNEEQWATWTDIKNQHRLSSNLQLISNDGSVYSDFSNETNHATIGTRPDYSEQNIKDYENYMRMLEQHTNNQLVIHQPEPISHFDVSTEEFTLGRGLVKGKFFIGFKYLDKLDSVYVKYHDIAKRKFYWQIWEKNQGNYHNYKDFKAHFNPKTQIWKEIKKTVKSDLSAEVKDLLHNKDPFNRSIKHSNIKHIRTSVQDRGNLLNARKNKVR